MLVNILRVKNCPTFIERQTKILITFIFIVSITYFWSLGEEVSSVGYIYRKLDREDYLISNHVVDCPSKVKIYLYKDIKCNKELYIRFVPQKQELQFYTNDGKVTYY